MYVHDFYQYLTVKNQANHDVSDYNLAYLEALTSTTRTSSTDALWVSLYVSCDVAGYKQQFIREFI